MSTSSHPGPTERVHEREQLRQHLLELRRRDDEVRAALVRDGTLFDGYAPRMEEVHRRNAAALDEILDRIGWPGVPLAAEDGAEAAWAIAQHAIGDPPFQRRCLALLRAAVERGEAPPRHAACLTDRIRFNERRPQRFGTVFDWDEEGCLSPWTLEAPDTVDERRADADLPPLAATVDEVRRRAEAEAEAAPSDFAARQRQIEAWSKKVGWL